jgi:hypothetical protein
MSIFVPSLLIKLKGRGFKSNSRLEKNICQSSKSRKTGMKKKINFVQLKYEILIPGCKGSKKLAVLPEFLTSLTARSCRRH